MGGEERDELDRREELDVLAKVLVVLGPVDDLALGRDIDDLLEGDGVPGNVLGERLPGLVVIGGYQDGIVHGEAGVLPGEELAGEVLVDEPLLHEVPHHPPAEAFGQACCILDWKMMKDAGSVNASLQRQGMPVWIEAEHIPEGLVRDDNARAHIRPGCLSAILFQQIMDDPGNTGKESAIIPKIGTQELGDAEDELPVRQLQEYVPVQMLREEQDPLLVAGGTEIPGLAGKGAEVLVAAVRIGALDTGYAFFVVAAVEDIKNRLLDTDNPEAAVQFCIPFLVTCLEGGKMHLQDALDEIPAPRDVDGCCVLHILLKPQKGQSYARIG